MKRRKSPKKNFWSTRNYWVEILVLCALLAVAVSLYSKPSSSPSKTAALQAKKSEQRLPAPKKPATTVARHTQEKKAAPDQQASRQEQAGSKPQPDKKAVQPSKPEPAKQQKPAEMRSLALTLALSGEEYSIIRVEDGDSLELADQQNRRFRVRLYGIDAPEGKQAYGSESRSNMRRLTKGKKVQIKRMYTDNYQRTVAIVFLSAGGKADALSLNERQVQDGMAWVYDFFCTSGECNTWKFEEAMAKNQKIGLWKNPSPIPPWQWRSMQNQ